MANETPNLAALSTTFGLLGPTIFKKLINDFDLSNDGVMVYKNVKTPIKLPKVSAAGGPRPYSSGDNTNNAVVFGDRELSAYQSKWDFDVDIENLRNTYLATFKPGGQSFAEYCIQVVGEAYLASINDNTVYLGVRNAAGTGAADIADGFGTILAAEITAANITPVTTTAITTSALAGSEIPKITSAVSVPMRKKGYRILCSYDIFDFYAAWYADNFKYSFNPDALGRYRINNQNAFIQPVSWLGTSQRLIATIDNNLSMGTDGDRIQVATSVRRNVIEARLMMPVGFQIGDLEALVVNSNA